MPTIDPTAPAVVVSADSHVGPRLRHELRPYCPSAYLDDFDAFADAMSGTADAESAARGLRLSNQEFRSGMRRSMDRSVDESQDRLLHPNGDRPGHYEPRARLDDMDADGVAAEIIYHASQNGEVLPFIGDVPVPQDERWAEYTDHAVVAYDIYNRWLADFCASDPKRLMGLAYIPVWDVDRCVETAKWARSAGLWGVNFPSCSRPGARPYNDQVWDPFWAACVDNDLVLNTHASGGPLFDYFSGPGGSEIVSFEAGGYMAIRAIWHLIFGQVFDRFPDLKVVFTEVAELFYTATQWEMDGWYNRMGRTPLAKGMPSAYFPSNVYQGASFMSPHQAEHTWREGYADNVIWGRDYPHREGSYQADLGTDDETFCRLTLRHVLSRVPLQEAIAMAGQNAVRAFGLDGDYLGDVASRIDAPTGEQLTTPVSADAYPITRPECRALTGAAGPRPVADEVMLHEHPVPRSAHMAHGVTNLYHATQRVPDLDAVQRFFAEVFRRDSAIIGDFLPRTDGVDYGIPRDYALFTPIAEVLVESIDPLRVRGGSEPVAEPRLSGLAWFVEGIDELWKEMRRHGMRGSGMDHVVLDGDEPPRTVSDTPFILTVPDETGMSYELLTFRPNRDPRGSPPLHAVLDPDPLGIECCAYHTVVTAQPERPLELLTEVLGGRVVHEDRNDVHGSQSTFVALGDGVVEIAVPLVEHSRAMERLREQPPYDSYFGLTWKVRDLEAVARHLTTVDVHYDRTTATTIVTDPADSLGVPWGFTTTAVPGDPAVRVAAPCTSPHVPRHTADCVLGTAEG